ncbi:WXG100 family type VII secretion target [Mycolicibacterium sp. J2]|jgi:WXG100 family type VII secretion target|uniref:WXG100 family type VII secretion target n=1 Tax=Mycolicibacterium sp. J2 TaxID=2993511 RepID=UPI00224B8C8B|nr:WXG100 family type VII secretion target [Mycolicibacterium sp. J2]MCX2712226.1 WXG100 family type VII secretion target [Mycolicibacterium sp. J2]
MSAFSVDPAALLAVIDRMTAFDGDLEGHLAQAAGSVMRLGSSWYGDGGEAELAAQARWNEGAREMRAALGRLRQIAEAAHENYSSAAQTNTRMWS